ncbi:hypothetical protein LSH36_395g02072 [Paralvinella palmiformis]|uniref:Uncharacterized protein n=1 Tax=Paralvinella palmiformis TaxID=53620 RepID=A0AAD9JCR6_9ANNE|nr:hypothetical protein LSH36_395g02072 [Paralvinella palmiformis]
MRYVFFFFIKKKKEIYLLSSIGINLTEEVPGEVDVR